MRRCIVRWQKRCSAIPGVKAAGYNRLIPLLEWGWNSGINMVGKPPDPPDHERLAEVRMVSPGWYQAMGLRLLRGRLPDPAIDKPGSPDVVVVNQKFVDTFLPGEEPIGQQIKQDPRIRPSSGWSATVGRRWRSHLSPRSTIPCRKCR